MSIAKIAAVVIAAALTGLASQAHATVFTYDLMDRGHNTLADGGFHKFTGGHPAYTAYSFEANGADVKLRYDDVAGTAKITGAGYNQNTGTLGQFDLFYGNVTQTGNTITLGDMGTVGTVEGQSVKGKGFDLTLLGDSISGDGWLVTSTGGHFGDFHFGGTRVAVGGCAGVGNGDNCGGGEVSVPAPLTLIGAIALFGAWRRRRSIAA